MNIHHAIVKKAATAGIVLTFDEDERIVTAHQPSPLNQTVSFTLPEEAESRDLNDLANEAFANVADLTAWVADEPRNKGFRITQDEDGQFVVVAPGGEPAEDLEPYAELAEAIAAVDDIDAEEGDDPEEEGDDPEEGGEEVSGSVVPAKYKEQYRLMSEDGQSNGDFLAQIMAARCHILDGKKERVDVDKVEALGYRNGLDYPAREGNRGWEGRYRMTVANMLRRKIAGAGVIIIPASLNDGKEIEIEVPAEFREKWAKKEKPKKEPKAPKEAKPAKGKKAKA